MPKNHFDKYSFESTEWDSEESKRKFAVDLLNFIEKGFKRTLFTKGLYLRLSMTFGHIAHYNIDGFFEEFFTTPQGRVRFLRAMLSYSAVGHPRFTFSDVERAVQAELKESRALERALAELNEVVEAEERGLLAALKKKYEGVK